MRIEEFCAQSSSKTRQIVQVIQEWQLGELDALVRKLSGDQDELVAGTVIASDGLIGDGLRDQIPGELRDAFRELMKEKADTYSEMRRILLERIRDTDRGFLALDDPRVQGFVNKLKGQIGENIFQRHVGTAAHLAPSGSQEGWDIAVRQADGLHNYVQVKLYADPHKVVEKMRSVRERVADGMLQGWDSETVNHIDFAVPENIADRVRHLAEEYPELHSMHVHAIPVSSSAAAEFVEEGLSNVGPDELSHFFHELLGGAVAAGSLHALVNGFLWYKGAKEFSDAFASAAASTTVSTTSIGIGLLAETVFDTFMFSSAIGIGSRVFLSRFARSRWNFGDFLKMSIAKSKVQNAALINLPQRAHC